VYEFPVLQRTGLIVVHQLPKTEETLWLRILGREGNQRQAIEEFTQQPTEGGLRASIEEVLTDYRAKLEDSGEKLTQEDEELIMNLSAAYMKRQQEWLEVGEERGIRQGIDHKAQEVAITALRKGLSIELIMELTGLSFEGIEKLREHLGDE
jgi:predicted transposase/invertase (TIGR01784 family)